MARMKFTPMKCVVVRPHEYGEADWHLQSMRKCHHEGKCFFTDRLWKLLQCLGYHNRTLYTGVRTPLREKAYNWKIQVTLY